MKLKYVVEVDSEKLGRRKTKEESKKIDEEIAWAHDVENNPTKYNREIMFAEEKKELLEKYSQNKYKLDNEIVAFCDKINENGTIITCRACCNDIYFPPKSDKRCYITFRSSFNIQDTFEKIIVPLSDDLPFTVNFGVICFRYIQYSLKFDLRRLETVTEKMIKILDDLVNDNEKKNG